MPGTVRDDIEKLMKDDKLTDGQKIDELLKLRSDCRAAQRAATESTMDAPDSLQTDLKHVDKALRELGFEKHADEQNAATL